MWLSDDVVDGATDHAVVFLDDATDEPAEVSYLLCGIYDGDVCW